MPINYSKEVQKAFKMAKAEVGDTILLKRGSRHYQGILMPRIEFGDPSSIVLKLSSGYNIGVSYGKGISIKKLKPAEKTKKPSLQKQKIDPTKPKVSIIATGGTIASKVDYRTGGVIPITTSEELVDSIPELKNIANIDARIVLSMFSEDMEPDHWSLIAKNVFEEIKKDCDGIIITHGTDTMYYTASALSFALQNLSIPVILVASQRSSDRGSSDATSNLLSAALFIAQSDYAGVAVCMHASPSDDKCWVFEANKTRKMHTSRRDTYRPINSSPLAEVNLNTRYVKFLQQSYKKKDKKRIVELKSNFSKKVGFIKVYPGFPLKLIDIFSKGFDGLVIEGYAFGQMPINVLDKYTKNHKKLLEKIKSLAKKIPVVMASQLPYGIVNMSVYSTSRDLVNAGIIPAYMQSYSAYVKLCWLLGNGKLLEEIKMLINNDFAGEVVERQEIEDFPYESK